MQISNSSKKISFKKTLAANCSIIKKENIPFPCSIYELTQEEDYDYFNKIPNKNDWNGARYLCYLKEDLESLNEKKNRKIYSIESKDGNCLGYSEIDYGTNKIDEILFLETVPTQNFSNREHSTFKYIGETLLSFLVKKSQKKKSKKIELQASIASINFYKNKCFFTTPQKELDPFFLRKRNFADLISQNEKHTQSTIELVG